MFANQLEGMTDTYLECLAMLGKEGLSHKGRIVYDDVEQDTYLLLTHMASLVYISITSY